MKVIVPRCRSGPVIFSLLSINLDGLILFRGCIRVVNSVTPPPPPYSSNFVNWLVVHEVGVETLLASTWLYWPSVASLYESFDCSKQWLTIHVALYLLRIVFMLWMREQGMASGENTRLPPMWCGFMSTRRHMWVEFVVGSLHCSMRLFPDSSGFPLSLKLR